MFWYMLSILYCSRYFIVLLPLMGFFKKFLLIFCCRWFWKLNYTIYTCFYHMIMLICFIAWLLCYLLHRTKLNYLALCYIRLNFIKEQYMIIILIDVHFVIIKKLILHKLYTLYGLEFTQLLHTRILVANLFLFLTNLY